MKIFVQILNMVIVFLSTQLYAKIEPDRFPNDIRYYTVQIKSFPPEERDNAQKLYEELKNKGYLVYKSEKHFKGKNYKRIRIEFFIKYSDAKEFAEKINKEEGYDYFIDFTDVQIDNYKNKFLIINLARSIVYKDNEKHIELYNGRYNRKANISPDGNDIVFADGRHKIFRLNINKKNLVILKETERLSDELYNPDPFWSPDGKYIAFLKYHSFEYPASLWIMDADGGNEKCIVPCCKIEKEHSVKSFQWHPSGKYILFSNGYTMGTISVGGDIYITDLEGNVNLIADADIKQRQEVFREFRIVGDTLYYKVAHFDDNFEQREYILNKKFIGNIK